MTKADFKNAILGHYIDRDKQVTVDRDPTMWSTGNGQLHRGVFDALLEINGMIEPSDKNDAIYSIFQCAVLPGLYSVNPGRPGRNSKDNYIGIAATASVYGFTPNIVSYGEGNRWSFDNTRPRNKNIFSPDYWKNWYGRFPGMIGYFYLCEQKIPSFIQDLGIDLLVDDDLTGDSGSDMQTWLQIYIASKSNGFSSALSYLENKIYFKYKTLGKMFEPYFGKDHPFSQILTMTGKLE